MSIQDFIEIDRKPGLGVVICKPHGYCIKPTKVHNHFNIKHQDSTEPSVRRQLQAYVNSQMSHLYEDIADVPLPTEPHPIIPLLPVYNNAAKCNTCAKIWTGGSAVDNVKTHIKREHGVQYNATPHGQRRGDWNRAWSIVRCQALFERNPVPDSTRFFEVYDPTEADLESTNDSPNASPPIDPALLAETALSNPAVKEQHLDEEIAMLEAQIDAGEDQVELDRIAFDAVIPAAPARQTHPYLETTRFQDCVEGLEWTEQRQYITPVPASNALVYLIKKVKSTALVYQWVTACTSRWARIQLMQESLVHVPQSPLIPYLGFDNKHSNVIVSVFTFFFQVLSNNKLPQPGTLELTPRQKRAWEAIQSHLDSLNGKYPDVVTKEKRLQLDDLEEKCHEFWLSLIEQTGTATDFQLALLTPLAFIAVDPQKAGFRAAYNFATDCSAVKKYARMAGCYQFFHANQGSGIETLDKDEEHPVFTEGDTEIGEAEKLIHQQQVMDAEYKRDEAAARARNNDLKAWVHHYISGAFHTPLSWVISTAQYIAKFRYGDTLDAFVCWQGDNVTVRNFTTSIGRFRMMVWNLYSTAQRLLTEIACCQHFMDLPAIPWNDIRCNPSENRSRYTPFSPKSTGMLDGARVVSNNLIAAMKAKKPHPSMPTNLENYEQIRRYSDKVEHFLDTLFLLIHFTSGQPGRLTEILSVQSENTVSNGIRNIFLFNGLVAVVPRYHKGYNRDKTLKIVYRFLPRQIGSLLVWYLWLVKPFCEQITAKQKMAHQTSLYFKARSAFIWSTSKGLQYPNAQRFAKKMKDITEAELGEPAGPNIMRHLMISFGRHLESDGKLVPLTPEELDEAISMMEEDVSALQAGHMPNTANSIYSLETARMFRSRAGEAASFFNTSQKWHTELGFEKQPTKDSDTYPRGKPFKSRPDVNINQVLRGNFGAGAQFRGEQKKVIQCILAGEPAVAYIAPTGGGKSLAFLLPAMCDGYGQTLVVTPLVALRTDLVKRCSKHGIRATVYSRLDFDETAKIIFAMPEHLNLARFRSVINRLQISTTLERIVVDEFHYILLPDHEYRPALLELRKIANHGVALTLLSATVPKMNERDAFRLLGIEDSVQVFRETTSQPKARYEVVNLPTSRLHATEDVAKYIQAQHTGRNKLLVYVARTSFGERLARLLGCGLYHGKLTESEREEIQHNFSSSPYAILVATAAFDHGIDISDISEVHMLGHPEHPIKFIQGAGRGGRDGRSYLVRIILGEEIPTFFPEQLNAKEKRVLEDIVGRGLSGTSCLRVPIDAYFDGDDKRTCCRTHEEPCIGCQRLRSRPSPSPPRDDVEPSSGQGTPKGKEKQSYDLSPCRSSHRFKPQVSTPPPRNKPKSSAHTPGLPTTTMGTLTLSSATSNKSWSSNQQLVQESPSQARGISKRTVSMSEDVPNLNDEAERHAVKRMRSARHLDLSRANVLEQNKAAIRFKDQLRQTGEWWVSNCAKCYVDGVAFDHPRADCDQRINEIVKTWRDTKLGNKCIKGTCYWCFLPTRMCARWFDTDTGAKLSNPTKGPDACSYPHAFIDTWACLWEGGDLSHMEEWKQRIESEGDGDPKKEDPWVKYFRGGVLLEDGCEIGRIPYDVHWYTQRFVRRETPSSAEDLDDKD